MIRLSEEVGGALADGRGVVALETTLVAHGFPPGEGIEVGLASERAVREGGAVPATIGVLDGEIVRRALTQDELARFDSSARKIGPRDTAAAVVQRRRRRDDRRRHARRLQRRPASASWRRAASAACTAAGPRRPTSRPTSACSRTTQALVVSSGVKSLLDVPATAELLETLGVPVLGWRTDSCRSSTPPSGGPPVSARVESADEAARDRDGALGARRRRPRCSAARRTRAWTTSSR